MLLENTFLLLLASDSLSGPTWDSMSIPVAVLCSFFIGKHYGFTDYFHVMANKL